MYTRNYGKPGRSGVRYNPPPGYDGNAFSEPPVVKLHEAEDDVTRLPRRTREIIPEAEIPLEAGDGFSDPETDEMSASSAEERKPAPAEVRTKPNDPETETPSEPEHLPVFGNGIQALETLFQHLRGRFGREELIIILVMLLVSSDGASLELMLLALILIAG